MTKPTVVTERPERAPSTLPDGAAASQGVAQLFNFTSFKDAWDAAEKIATTSLVPPAFKSKPAEIVAAWQFGLELGLPPMQALTAIAVINGRPSLYGDGFLAVIKSSRDFVDCVETFDADTQTATCVMRRRGCSDVERSFSMADAQKANLTGKSSPWKEYPNRMLQMRARGFAGRDQFADVLRGMALAEEAADIHEREVAGEVLNRAPAASRSETLLNRLKPQTESAASVGKDTAAASADPDLASTKASSDTAPELSSAGSEPEPIGVVPTLDEMRARLRAAGSEHKAINKLLDEAQARGMSADDVRELNKQARVQLKGG